MTVLGRLVLHSSAISLLPRLLEHLVEAKHLELASNSVVQRRDVLSLDLAFLATDTQSNNKVIREHVDVFSPSPTTTSILRHQRQREDRHALSTRNQSELFLARFQIGCRGSEQTPPPTVCIHTGRPLYNNALL